MTEDINLKSQTSLFPFKCENSDCQKEYDLDQFAEVVLLWGYIYLIAEKHEAGIVGFTCPKCRKTTLKKLPGYMAMQSLLVLRQKCFDKYWENKYISKPELKYCIYFSVQHLFALKLIDTVPKIKDKNIEYSIPLELELDNYSGRLQVETPFVVSENEIPFILKLENENGFKAFPRTVPSTSIYINLDKLNLDHGHEHINFILNRDLIRPNSRADVDHISKYNISPAETNDLSFAEFCEFRCIHLSWKRKPFQDNINDFLNAIPAVRNRIDCEIIYRNQLINKYARKFYYQTRTIEEQQFENKELQKFEEFGLEEVVNVDFTDIDSSILIYSIHGGQLMEKWGLDALGIINLIQHHGLFAYDSFHSAPINKDFFDPTLIAELTTGDLEKQKLFMQRLLFDPDHLFIFETSKKFDEYFSSKKKADKIEPNKAVSIKKHSAVRAEKDRKEIRVIAKKMWDEDPELTIGMVLSSDEIKKISSEEQESFWHLRTLRQWIIDLRPNRQTEKKPSKNLEIFKTDKFQSDAISTPPKMPKEILIEQCRKIARKLVKQNPTITLKEIINTHEFKMRYKGKEKYIPNSDSGWRNWLKGIYSAQKGRKKGT